MFWVLLIILTIGSLFAGALRLLSRKNRTDRFEEIANPYERESLEDKLADGALDVEEYKALNAVVQPDDNNIV